VLIIATNGYQSLLSEAEIDPAYGNQTVLLSLAEDDKPMTLAPYSSTNKAPAQLVVPADYKGGGMPTASAAWLSSTEQSDRSLARHVVFCDACDAAVDRRQFLGSGVDMIEMPH